LDYKNEQPNTTHYFPFFTIMGRRLSTNLSFG